MDRFAAIAGQPVLHSRSPDLCAEALARAGVDGAYTRLWAASAAEALEVAAAAGMRGVQLTSPFKEAALPHLVETSVEARRAGAVNTVLLDGAPTGMNTDVDGVRSMLDEAGLRRGRVAILGAGGAARAAVVALADAGLHDVVLVNRTPARARRAAAHLGCEWAPLDRAAEALASADAVISCVPGGVLPEDLCEAGRGPWLDASYTAPERAAAATAAGRPYLDGRTWLVGQAKRALHALTGHPPDAAALARAALRPARPRPPAVALCGLPGAGKSTVGPLLAARLDLPPADLDRWVEDRAGQAIPSLWAREGEEAFRARETDAARDLLDGTPRVVSLGGGSLEDRNLRDRVLQTALVVWLWVPAHVCEERVDASTRPLLAHRSLSDLLEARRPAWAASADLVVSTQGRTPAQVAEVIHAEIRAAWPA